MSGIGSPNTTRIVIADDHQLVRSGIRMLLDREPDLEVLAEAGDIDATRRYVKGHHPDVLVVDLTMPGPSVLEAIPQILREAPQTTIVVLTMQDDPAVARAALRAGALAYVLKEAAEGELVEAIRHAAMGKAFLSPQLGVRIAAEPPAGPPDDLSDIEVQILRGIALGHPNHEIASALFLSVRTVELHRQRIHQKLGLTRRSDLVRYALAHGLLDQD